MSETAAAVSAPAAPAAPPPPAAEAAPMAPNPQQPEPASGGAKARDLAGKFLRGAAQPDPAVTPDGESAPVAVKDPKAEAKASEDKKASAERAAADAEKAKLDKGFKELRRRAKQSKNLVVEKAQFESTRSQHQRELAEDARLKEEDPPAWLEKHQFDFRKVAEAAIAKENETPEQRAEKARAEADEKDRAETKKRLDAIDERERAIKHREAVATLNGEVDKAWPLVKESYPVMAEGYTADEIRDTANALRIDYWNENKREVPLDDVFAFMEKNAAREASRWKRENAASTERATVATAEAAGETRAMGRPTVTNRDSSTRASPQASLSADERRARAIAKTRESWRGDS